MLALIPYAKKTVSMNWKNGRLMKEELMHEYQPSESSLTFLPQVILVKSWWGCKRLGADRSRLGDWGSESEMFSSISASILSTERPTKKIANHVHGLQTQRVKVVGQNRESNLTVLVDSWSQLAGETCIRVIREDSSQTLGYTKGNAQLWVSGIGQKRTVN